MEIRENREEPSHRFSLNVNTMMISPMIMSRAINGELLLENRAKKLNLSQSKRVWAKIKPKTRRLTSPIVQSVL